MKRLTALFIIATLFGLRSYSQNATIKGTVIDTAEKTNLYRSVISLIRYEDSVLVKFARSGKDGKFIIKNVPAGRFYLITTYPTYADFVDEITLSGDSVLELGNLVLTPEAKLLEEVIVRQNVAIRIKGDTIEYKADSFKVAEGSNVQELLRKMPGFQVDRNGQITAQGQKVERVLVDGEEFFSDDPAVVTQNLRADAIDKVQSFDKKSDQAEFTGIDDGVRSKTVNLVMKDDKKKGYFGKLSAGVGTDERHNGEAMLNYFKGKKKVSAYGFLSNTGKVGLNWDERDKFGGGMDMGDGNIEVGAGFIMISGGGDNDFNDWSSSFNGEGIPNVFKGGAHFSNKWNNDFNHVNGNYSIKKMDVSAVGSSITRYNQDDVATYNTESHRRTSSQMQQTFTGFYDLKLDSFSSIRFRLNGLMGNSKSFSNTDASVLDEDQNPIRRNRRDNISDADNKIVLASVLWRQRLKKKGRTFSLFASHKYSDVASTGYLIGDIFSYDTDYNPIVDSSFDQYKTRYNKVLTTQARAVYTEPLGKKTSLELNYTFNRNASTSDRKTFDNVNGKYEAFNRDLSISYDMLFYSNTGGAKVQYNGKKLVVNLGTNAGVSNYIQRDSLDKKVNHFKYTNLFPSARINYRFSTQRSLMLQYNGSPQPPSIEQIQPVRVNDDPFNIRVGNPDLKQAFNNNFSMFYNDFKVLTGRSVWLNLSFNTTSNAIVQSQSFDKGTGVRTLRYTNTSGNRNLFYYASYGFKLKKPEININMDFNGHASRFVNFVDGEKNIAKNGRVGLGLGLYRYKDGKYSFGIRGGISKNFGSSSNNPGALNDFWLQDHSIDANVFFTKRFSIGTNLDINLREKVDAFDQNNNAVMWNANIIYKIFPKRNGEFKFEAFDILNQRIGFERNFAQNYVMERTYQVLQQYFMLTFTWNFTKTPAAEDPKK